MLIFVAFLYFFLACGIGWFAFFPSGREFLVRLMAGLGERIEFGIEHWQRGRSRRAGMVERNWRIAAHNLRSLGRHRWPLAAGAVLVGVPPLAAWLLGARAGVETYRAAPLPDNPHVAELLKGEQLAPPLPLPPLAFTAAEVALVRPMLGDASRNWGLLHADFSQRLLVAFKIMQERHGYQMALLEGYRSPARQDLLARMGPHVSNAGAFQSYHQYGLAADCAFLRDGRIVISEKDPWAMRGYRLYGEVAESLGLTWGGRWKMMDLGHTELRLRGTIKR